MRPIAPYLWCNLNAEEMMQFYTSIFPNSRIVSIDRFPSEPLEGHLQGQENKVANGVFELEGYRLYALDGGPMFKINPSISLFVSCDTEEEIDQRWARLSDGGMALMPLAPYPFSPKFGWIQDKYGVSWQLMLGSRPQKIIPFLMFVNAQHGKAEEAANFYVSLFKDSGIESLKRHADSNFGEVGTVENVLFRLNGGYFIGMDSHFEHEFNFNEAVSLYVECADQAEVDYLWNKLSADPEAEACGWLKDKYGVSWQIIPEALGRLMSDPDPEKSQRVMAAILQMKKILVADLEKAYAGA